MAVMIIIMIMMGMPLGSSRLEWAISMMDTDQCLTMMDIESCMTPGRRKHSSSFTGVHGTLTPAQGVPRKTPSDSRHIVNSNINRTYSDTADGCTGLPGYIAGNQEL